MIFETKGLQPDFTSIHGCLLEIICIGSVVLMYSVVFSLKI